MLQQFMDWLERPYREDMTAFDWIAFVLLILFGLFIWGWIMSRLN